MRKRMLSLVFAIVMVCTLFAFPASAATVTLPDGGSTTNSGVEIINGRSSGGNLGHVTYTCSVLITTDTMDTATVRTQSSVNMGNRLFISFTVTGTDGARETNRYQSSSSTGINYSRSVSDEAEYYQMATAGFSITLDGYGYWNCGATARR